MQTKKASPFTYCERLKELRSEHPWTIEQAAIQFGITKSTLNSYETPPDKPAGRRPPIEFLLKACDIYGVTLDYLCGRFEKSGTIDEIGETLDDIATSKLYGLSPAAFGTLRLAKRDYPNAISVLNDLLGYENYGSGLSFLTELHSAFHDDFQVTINLSDGSVDRLNGPEEKLIFCQMRANRWIEIFRNRFVQED